MHLKLPPRLYLVFLLCLGFSGADLSSQGLFDKVYFGIKAGPVYSYFNDAQPHTGGKAGVIAGFTAEHRSFQRLFFVTGINYCLQGGKYMSFNTEYFGGGDGTDGIILGYFSSNSILMHNVDIPIMARVYLSTQNKVLPYMFAGPSLSVNLAVFNDYDHTDILASQHITWAGYENLTRSYKMYQAYVNLGLGTEFYINTRSFNVEIAYKYGLTPVKTVHSFLNNYKLTGDLYNDSFFITLGYGF